MGNEKGLKRGSWRGFRVRGLVAGVDVEVRAADHRGCNETWNLRMQANSGSRVSLRCVANDAAGCLIGKRIVDEGVGLRTGFWVLGTGPQDGASIQGILGLTGGAAGQD